MDEIIFEFDLHHYRRFLEVKKTPIHQIKSIGNGSYNLSVRDGGLSDSQANGINISRHLFDYQQFITRIAYKKQRYAIFADVGLGKTAIFLEWIRLVRPHIKDLKIVIVSQLHIINQTIEEDTRFYGSTILTDINKQFHGDIEAFIRSDAPIGIVNVDKFRNHYALSQHVGAIVLDESSILKNEAGKLRTNLIRAFKGVPWKLCCTATPAPNDRQEYANHALFLDYITNFNQFFHKYFYNTNSTDGFVLKPHARAAFYEFLSTWSIFLKNPAHYGFGDNLHGLQPPDVFWVDVPLTGAQRRFVSQYIDNGQMGIFRDEIAGGIKNRTKVSQIAKGFMYGESKSNSDQIE